MFTSSTCVEDVSGNADVIISRSETSIDDQGRVVQKLQARGSKTKPASIHVHGILDELSDRLCVKQKYLSPTVLIDYIALTVRSYVPDHFVYQMMYLYKTRPCPTWKAHGWCEFDENQCFDFHDPGKQRRAPSRDDRGWNYQTDDAHANKCRVGYNDHQNCGQKFGCRAFHTLVEMNFHPTQYKRISQCAYPIDKCPNGPKCWQYHRNANDKIGKQYPLPQTAQEASVLYNEPPPAHFVDWFRKQNAEKCQTVKTAQNIKKSYMPFPKN